MKLPDPAYAVENHQIRHYTAKPDLAEDRREHDAFAALLEAEGIEVNHYDEPKPGRADTIFTYDARAFNNKLLMSSFKTGHSIN